MTAGAYDYMLGFRDQIRMPIFLCLHLPHLLLLLLQTYRSGPSNEKGSRYDRIIRLEENVTYVGTAAQQHGTHVSKTQVCMQTTAVLQS